MKQFLEQKVQASFTVEAAFIIPAITLTIFFLIYMLFYLYNETISLQEAYLYVVRCSQKWEYNEDDTNQKIASRLQRQFSDFQKEMLLSSEEVISNVSIGNGKINLEYKFVTKTPFSEAMYTWTGTDVFNTDNTITYILLDPVLIKRTGQTVSEWVSKD